MLRVAIIRFCIVATITSLGLFAFNLFFETLTKQPVHLGKDAVLCGAMGVATGLNIQRFAGSSKTRNKQKKD